MAKDDTWLKEELFRNVESVVPYYNGSMHGGLRKSSSASFFSKVGRPLCVELPVTFHAANAACTTACAREPVKRRGSQELPLKAPSLMLLPRMQSLN